MQLGPQICPCSRKRSGKETKREKKNAVSYEEEEEEEEKKKKGSLEMYMRVSKYDAVSG